VNAASTKLYETDLLRGGDELDHLLKSASAVLVQSNLDERRGCIADESITLLIGGELEQLLAKVVAERIWFG
jgi:hypothetical protein